MLRKAVMDLWVRCVEKGFTGDFIKEDKVWPRLWVGCLFLPLSPFLYSPALPSLSSTLAAALTASKMLLIYRLAKTACVSQLRLSEWRKKSDRKLGVTGFLHHGSLAQTMFKKAFVVKGNHT
jgi:hypothetical protein